jgi:transcriptional regulator with XRE-family HTH domain
MQPSRIPISAPAERRIWRESRSATLRERATALRKSGWTLARIAEAFGISISRASQIVRKGERIAERVAERNASITNEKGAPATTGRPSDSTGPLAADRNKQGHLPWLPPPTG